MNAAARSTDAAKLKAIRASLDAIAPADWTRAHDEHGGLIEARDDMAAGGRCVLARFSDATVEEIEFACNAPDAVRFLIDLLRRAFDEIRLLRGDPPVSNPKAEPPAASEPKNYAAECAMKCQEPAFKVFLEERHGLERPLTNERAAQKVRSLLGVTSRKELNEGGRAGDAWKDLRASFAAWLKAQR
ncbi:hypothetical protein [Mesorhizobium japonicum]|uniref:Mlr8516 protein n=1 Tax=Mesorhizobium japonicum (strain LMG 29417 / CECT 9101 / MAFF 303099) TaxID=266835 RepID=Q982S7_RHILO|nr:hypothetical protein [Mesorhizobium japonicum]BAB54379.1 mlr8516 [Mesorhizobium japonicum MAFF 303099]